MTQHCSRPLNDTKDRGQGPRAGTIKDFTKGHKNILSDGTKNIKITKDNISDTGFTNSGMAKQSVTIKLEL